MRFDFLDIIRWQSLKIMRKRQSGNSTCFGEFRAGGCCESPFQLLFDEMGKVSRSFFLHNVREMSLTSNQMSRPVRDFIEFSPIFLFSTSHDQISLVGVKMPRCEQRRQGKCHRI